MKISQKSEYALAAILDLSLVRPGELAKVAEVALRQQIPPKFLELILAELKQRGFVTSRRGANGGYRLAKAAEKITVGDILTCLGERRRRKTRDGLTELLNQVERSVWSILDSTTFAEIASNCKDGRVPERVALLDLSQVIGSVSALSAGPGGPSPASISLAQTDGS